MFEGLGFKAWALGLGFRGSTGVFQTSCRVFKAPCFGQALFPEITGTEFLKFSKCGYAKRPIEMRGL